MRVSQSWESRDAADTDMGATEHKPRLPAGPGSLTHCFYLHVDEVLDVLLQGLMGLQGDGQVAVVLSVAEVHLEA